MEWTRDDGVLRLATDRYRLEFAGDRPFVRLEDSRGQQIAELLALSSIHPLHARDDTTGIGAWSVIELPGQVIFSLEATSSAWERKTFRFICREMEFDYQVEIHGAGRLAEALLLGGYYSGQPRWGSGMFLSGQQFRRGFNPEPGCDEQYTFSADGGSSINMTGVPLPGKDDWFFTPPPFCFAFEITGGWLGMGVAAQPGENRFTEFAYHGRRGAFFLSLDYEGYTEVNGAYCLPAITFQFGSDPYTVLASHASQQRAAGTAGSRKSQPRPDWWLEPIFCGWGAQCCLAKDGGGRPMDYATQEAYEGFMDALAAHDLHPGTVVLDDQWQVNYGENLVDPHKWPDLPGFVSKRHAAGQRVLLWLKAWSPDGLPAEECITNAAGLPVAADPTNPAYEQRLRASVRRMLSPQGYDADGFKIDFSARIPCGPGMHRHGDAWGLELMRLYLGIIHDEARKTKPDAFIIAHTPHPYLSDLIDAIRLNDINTAHDVRRQMIHRARVAAIACPDALIDMDNWPMPDKAAWKRYLDLRPFLGIPALYFATHVDSTGEPLIEDDYAQIRTTWAEYRSELAASLQAISDRAAAFIDMAPIL